jgi:hypothetical protein
VLELEEREKARPIEKSLEPAPPPIQPPPAEQQRFTEPLDAEPDPEPVQPPAWEDVPPDVPDQPTP